jgi:hypothetical protein
MVRSCAGSVLPRVVATGVTSLVAWEATLLPASATEGCPEDPARGPQGTRLTSLPGTTITRRGG